MEELLLAEQAWWDPRQFDPKGGYVELKMIGQKVNHIQTHVGWAALKFNGSDFKVRVNEVAPDLAIYRSQLVNLFDMDTDNITENYRPVGNLNNILYEIVAGGGKLAKYIERLQHGDALGASLDKVEDAARHMHVAARSTLDFYYPGKDSAEMLMTMQKSRMEQRLGEPLPDPLV